MSVPKKLDTSLDQPAQPKRGTLPVKDRLTPEELYALRRDDREAKAEIRRLLGRD